MPYCTGFPVVWCSDQIKEISKCSHKPHQQQDVNHGRYCLKRCHTPIVLGFLCQLVGVLLQDLLLQHAHHLGAEHLSSELLQLFWGALHLDPMISSGPHDVCHDVSWRASTCTPCSVREPEALGHILEQRFKRLGGAFVDHLAQTRPGLAAEAQPEHSMCSSKFIHHIIEWCVHIDHTVASMLGDSVTVAYWLGGGDGGVHVLMVLSFLLHTPLTAPAARHPR